MLNGADVTTIGASVTTTVAPGLDERRRVRPARAEMVVSSVIETLTW